MFEIRVYQSYVPISSNFQADKRFLYQPSVTKENLGDPYVPFWPPFVLELPCQLWSELIDPVKPPWRRNKKTPLGMFPKPRMVWLMWVPSWKIQVAFFSETWDFCPNVPCLLSEQVVMSLARTHLHPKLVWRCDVGRHLSSWLLSGTNWHVERDCSLDIIWRKLVIGVVLGYE